MDPENPSPLHRFVVAKRSIGSIFDQLLEFVKSGSAFVDGQKHSARGSVVLGGSGLCWMFREFVDPSPFISDQSRTGPVEGGLIKPETPGTIKT